MSITKGLGEHWGSYLVTEPFKFKLKRLIKKLVRKFIRYIPYKRKKFKLEIRITGDVYYPKHVLMTVPVRGERDTFWVLWTLIDEE